MKFKKIIMLMVVISIISAVMPMQSFAYQKDQSDYFISMFSSLECDIIEETYDRSGNISSFKIKFSEDDIAYVEKTTNKADGSISYAIQENNITSQVTITETGEFQINGETVMYSVDGGKEKPLMVNQQITPKVAHQHEIVSYCPYGSASAYTNGSIKSYSTTIGNATFGTINKATYVSIVLTLIGMTGVTGAALAFGLSLAYTAYQQNIPAARAFSMKNGRYVHNTLGFNVTDSMAVAKYQTTYYYDPYYTVAMNSTPAVSYEKFTY